MGSIIIPWPEYTVDDAFTDSTLTCVEALEAQHRVVEDQQVGEPHGGAQVVEKVPHRVAEPPRGGQGPPRGRHDASRNNDGTTGENLASRSLKKVEKRMAGGAGIQPQQRFRFLSVPLLAVLERTSYYESSCGGCRCFKCYPGSQRNMLSFISLSISSSLIR